MLCGLPSRWQRVCTAASAPTAGTKNNTRTPAPRRLLSARARARKHERHQFWRLCGTNIILLFIKEAPVTKRGTERRSLREYHLVVGTLAVLAQQGLGAVRADGTVYRIRRSVVRHRQPRPPLGHLRTSAVITGQQRSACEAYIYGECFW